MVADNILGLLFAIDPVERGLRITFAGGIVTAAMSLLTVISVPEWNAGSEEAASMEGAQRGQS